jgi:rod shape-determining protein MreB and related proteins
LGSAMGRDDGRVEPVLGRTVIRGESVVVSVGADPVHRAIAESLQQVTRMIQECFTETQPDLAFDVAARGMTLAGGGAYINDVVDLLENVLGVTVRVAPEADRAVINGLRICMEEMSTLDPMLRATT